MKKPQRFRATTPLKFTLPQCKSTFLLRTTLCCAIGLFSLSAQAQTFPYRYRYVSLKDKAPTGFSNFRPVAINDKLQIAATVAKCSKKVCTDYVARYEKNGLVDVFKKQPAVAHDINNVGTIIGSRQSMHGKIINYLFFADNIKIVNVFENSTILGFNDVDNVFQLASSPKGSHYLLHTQQGDAKINLASNNIVPNYTNDFEGKHSFLNNKNIVAGLSHNANGSSRFFRFDTKTQKANLSNPILANQWPTLLGINNRNDVLGVWQPSSFSGPTYVGIWDANWKFTAYGISASGAKSIVFNNNRLIVESVPQEESTSYPESCSLLLKQDVRLDVAQLTQNMPANDKLLGIYDINNVGDMIGYSRHEMFLLQRIDGKWGKRFQ